MRGERMLQRGRALAESLMQATCRISRPVGEATRNPDTGKLETAFVTVYEGACRVRFMSADPHSVDQAGQRFAVQSPTVWVPTFASGVRVDDVGVLLESPHEPGDVGLRFRVAGVHAQTHSTACRLPVEVLSHA